MYKMLSRRKMPIYKFLRHYKEQRSSLFIKNGDFPLCINCIYFIKDTNNYPYDPPPNDKQFGRCKIFGEKNMVTGEIEYDYAASSRIREDKCGISGKYFELKTDKE